MEVKDPLLISLKWLDVLVNRLLEESVLPTGLLKELYLTFLDSISRLKLVDLSAIAFIQD